MIIWKCHINEEAKSMLLNKKQCLINEGSDIFTLVILTDFLNQNRGQKKERKKERKTKDAIIIEDCHINEKSNSMILNKTKTNV